MSGGEYGFFLGIAPGVVYTLRNLTRVQRVVREAEAIARERGAFLDINSSPVIRFNYVFRPGRFIQPEDKGGIRQAKSRLLAIRRQAIRSQIIGTALVLIGGVLGVAITIGIAPES